MRLRGGRAAATASGAPLAMASDSHGGRPTRLRRIVSRIATGA
jgi:hypothetical protein